MRMILSTLLAHSGSQTNFVCSGYTTAHAKIVFPKFFPSSQEARVRLMVSNQAVILEKGKHEAY